MENYFLSASKRFWQTLRHLRRKKWCFDKIVYNGEGVLLTKTGDIIRQWKEYFGDLLNMTDMPSTVEVEVEEFEQNSPITRAEVPIQLCSSKALGVDEICPKFLKEMLLTCLG